MLFSPVRPFLVHSVQEFTLDRINHALDLDLVELLLVRVGTDVGRVGDQDSPRHEAVGFGLPQDVLEDLLENVLPFEAAPIGLTNRRMVGHLLVNPEPEEPAIGEVRLDLFHRLADGTDIEQRAEEDDLDDDLGVDARLSGVRVQWRAKAVHDREIDVAVELSDEVVLRDQLVQGGLRLDRFMSLLRMGTVHVGFLPSQRTGSAFICLFPFSPVRRTCLGFLNMYTSPRLLLIDFS